MENRLGGNHWFVNDNILTRIKRRKNMSEYSMVTYFQLIWFYAKYFSSAWWTEKRSYLPSSRRSWHHRWMIEKLKAKSKLIKKAGRLWKEKDWWKKEICKIKNKNRDATFSQNIRSSIMFRTVWSLLPLERLSIFPFLSLVCWLPVGSQVSAARHKSAICVLRPIDTPVAYDNRMGVRHSSVGLNEHFRTHTHTHMCAVYIVSIEMKFSDFTFARLARLAHLSNWNSDDGETMRWAGALRGGNNCIRNGITDITEIF